MVRMVDVVDMPTFPGVDVPDDFWWAMSSPIPLAGMSYPRDFDWATADALGFRTVVCLTGTDPAYDPSPLHCAAAPLEDLYHGEPPASLDGELAAVRRAVDIVTASLVRCDGVLVHCAGGTGRSGTVLGAALVVLGEDPHDVAAWLDRVHSFRGRRGWPESAWQRSVLELFAEWR